MEFIKTAGIPVDPGHNVMWRLHTTNNLGMMECKLHHNKIVNNFLSIILTFVLGAQKNHLIKTVLLSTHNICFG